MSGGRRPLDQADQPQPIDPPIETTFINIIYCYYSAWRLNYSFCHPTEGRRLSRPLWLVTYRDGLPACRHSPIQVLTRPGVEQLCWSDPTCCCYAMPPTSGTYLVVFYVVVWCLVYSRWWSLTCHHCMPLSATYSPAIIPVHHTFGWLHFLTWLSLSQFAERKFGLSTYLRQKVKWFRWAKVLRAEVMV